MRNVLGTLTRIFRVLRGPVEIQGSTDEAEDTEHCLVLFFTSTRSRGSDKRKIQGDIGGLTGMECNVRYFEPLSHSSTDLGRNQLAPAVQDRRCKAGEACLLQSRGPLDEIRVYQLDACVTNPNLCKAPIPAT